MEQISSLLCAISLCALLLCALVLVFPFQDGNDPSSEAAASLKQPLIRCAAADLDQISWRSGEDNFLLVNQGSHFLLNNTTDIPLRQEAVAQLLQLFENFPSGEGSTPPQRPADLELKLLPTRGKEQSFQLWTMEKGVCISNGSRAQLLPPDKVLPLFQGAAAYADLALTGNLPTSATLELQGALHSIPLSLSYYIEENKCYGGLISPTNAPIPQDQLSPLLASLQQLSADQARSLYPELQDLGELFCTLTLASEQENYVLHASHPDTEGNVLLIKEGLPVLYTIHQSKLPWLSTSTETLTEQELFQADYEDCIAFTLQTPEERIRFTKWDGLVLQGGRPVDEGDFRRFFRETMSLIPSAAALRSPAEGSALLTISLSYTNPEKATDRILFLPYTEDELLLSINGESRFLVPADTFHRILDHCQQLTAS